MLVTWALLAEPGPAAAQETPPCEKPPPEETEPPEEPEAPEESESPVDPDSPPAEEAEDAPEPELTLRDRWKVAAELSYSDQSGNNVLRLLSGGLEISHREKEAFEFESILKSRYGKSEGDVVARNHFASLSLDLHPRDDWSPFLYLTAERDPFKRLDLRFSGGAGAKYKLQESQRAADELSMSLALLYSYEDIRPVEADPFGPNTSRARWSLRVRGGRELRPGATLRHVTFYQPIWDELADYLLRSETGARLLLTERLGFSLSYQMDRTARPPEGVTPDDRLFKTGLIIEF